MTDERKLEIAKDDVQTSYLSNIVEFKKGDPNKKLLEDWSKELNAIPDRLLMFCAVLMNPDGEVCVVTSDSPNRFETVGLLELLKHKALFTP